MTIGAAMHRDIDSNESDEYTLVTDSRAVIVRLIEVRVARGGGRSGMVSKMGSRLSFASRSFIGKPVRREA